MRVTGIVQPGSVIDTGRVDNEGILALILREWVQHEDRPHIMANDIVTIEFIHTHFTFLLSLGVIEKLLSSGAYPLDDIGPGESQITLHSEEWSAVTVSA
jgi:hypothetical protein